MLLRIPIPLHYTEFDIIDWCLRAVGRFMLLAFAERGEDGNFEVVALPAFFETRRKIYAFEVPKPASRYAIVRLMSIVRGFTSERLRRICHPILMKVPDAGQDIMELCGERFGRLFSPSVFATDALKLFGLLVDRTYRFTAGGRMRVLWQNPDGEGVIMGGVDVLVNPIVIANTSEFDWKALKAKTRSVLKATAIARGLIACLNQFYNEELVARKCNACQGTVARIGCELFYLPRYLVIQVARFSNECKKITTEVECPDILMLKEGGTGRELRYQLYAVCKHTGGVMGGHYTAMLLSAERGDWILCDGDRLSREKLKNVHTDEAAYLLFYEQLEYD